jgi:hypothetical protein
MTLGQIAERLGVTERAVRSHLFRARQVMRSALAKTVAVLLGLVAAVRRGLVAAGSVATVAAALVLFAVAPGQASGPTTGASPIVISEQAGSLPTALVQIVPPMTASPPTAWSSPGLAHSVAKRRPAQPTVARVDGPAHANVWVTAGDSGTHENGPVAQVVACAEHVTVTRQHVGC